MVFLSIWGGLNLLAAVACLLAITVFHQNAPGITWMLDESKIREIDRRWLSGLNGLAALCNTFDAAFCFLMLVVVWTSLVRKARWAFWGLLIATVFLQVFAFVSYSFFDTGFVPKDIVTMN